MGGSRVQSGSRASTDASTSDTSLPANACCPDSISNSTAPNAHTSVGVVAVDPLFTGLGDEGQRAQPLHGHAHRFVLVSRVPAEASREAETLSFVEPRDLRLSAVGDAGGVREEHPDRDGALPGLEGDLTVGSLYGDRGLFELSRDGTDPDGGV